MVLGDIIRVHVHGSIVRSGRVDPHLLEPISRFGVNSYAEFTKIYKLLRSTWADIQNVGPSAKLPKFKENAWCGVETLQKRK